MADELDAIFQEVFGRPTSRSASRSPGAKQNQEDDERDPELDNIFQEVFGRPTSRFSPKKTDSIQVEETPAPKPKGAVTNRPYFVPTPRDPLENYWKKVDEVKAKAANPPGRRRTDKTNFINVGQDVFAVVRPQETGQDVFAVVRPQPSPPAPQPKQRAKTPVDLPDILVRALKPVTPAQDATRTTFDQRQVDRYDLVQKYLNPEPTLGEIVYSQQKNLGIDPKINLTEVDPESARESRDAKDYAYEMITGKLGDPLNPSKTFDEFKDERSRTRSWIRASQTPVGSVLSMLMQGKVNPASPLVFNRYTLELANSILPNAISASMPETYGHIMDATRPTSGIGKLADVALPMAGMVAGVATGSSLAARAGVKLGLGEIIAAQVTPGNVAGAITGQQSIPQAAAQIAAAWAGGTAVSKTIEAAPVAAKLLGASEETALGRMAPVVLNMIGQAGVGVAQDLANSVITGEPVSKEQVLTNTILNTILSYGDVKATKKNLKKDAAKTQKEIKRIGKEITSATEAIAKTAPDDPKYTETMDKIQALTDQRAELRAQQNIAAPVIEHLDRIPEQIESKIDNPVVAENKTEPAAEVIPEDADLEFPPREVPQTETQIVPEPAAEVIPEDADLEFPPREAPQTETQIVPEPPPVNQAMRAKDVDVPPKTTESAGFGAPPDTRERIEGQQRGNKLAVPTGKVPVFEEGAYVYTYRTDKAGTRIGGPVSGHIVTKDVVVDNVERQVQYIKHGKKLIPVSENTLARGQRHPLTSGMTGEGGGASPFIVRYITNKISESLGAEFTNDLLNKLRPRMERLGLFTAERTQEGQTSKIGIDVAREIFADPNLAESVVGHEFGHVIDYIGGDNIPATLKRGSLYERINALGTSLTKEEKSRFVKEHRAELESLSEAWNPVSAESSEQVKEYRKKPQELYADMVSVMLNNPELARQIAPNAVNQWETSLAKKPIAEQAIKDLRALLSGDEETIGSLVREEMRDMLVRSKEVVEKNLAKESKNTNIGLTMRGADAGKAIAQGFNQYSPLYSLHLKIKHASHNILKKAKVTWRDYEKYALARERGESGDAGYSPEQSAALREVYDKMGNPVATDAILAAQANEIAPGQQMKMVQDLWHNYIEPVIKSGADNDDIGEYMLYTSIVGNHRAGLANPGMIGQAEASAALKKLHTSLGPEKMSLIETAANQIRNEMFTRIKEAKDLGMIHPDDWALFERNRDSYARLSAAEYVGRNMPYVSDHIKGVVRDVANPLLTTMQNILALDTKIRQVRAAKEAVKIEGSRELPEGVTKAETPGMDVLRVPVNGEWKHFEVDPSIVDMFKYDPMHLDRRLTGVSEIVRRLVTEFREFDQARLIKLSVPFNFRNFFRDMFGSLLYVPGRFVKNVPGAYKEAYARGNFFTEAERSGLLRPQSEMQTLAKEYSPGVELLKLLGFKTPEPPVSTIRKIFSTGVVGEGVEKIVNLEEAIEATTKLAAYKEFLDRGHSKEEAVYLARHGGTPDTRIKGSLTGWFQYPYIFFNTALQGSARFVRNARDPQTRGAMMTRFLMYGVAPKMAQWTLQYGLAKSLFDEDSDERKWLEKMQRYYARISEDAKRRYLVLPTADAQWGKPDDPTVGVFNITIPSDETTYAMTAQIDNLIKLAVGDRDMGDAAYNAGSNILGVIPNESPWLMALSHIAEYAKQGNIYEDYRQMNVLSPNLEAIAKADRLNPEVLSRLGEWALGFVIGPNYHWARSVHNAVTGTGDGTASFVPGLFSRTASGTRELEARAYIEQNAQKALEGIKRKETIKKAKETGDVQPIVDMYIDGIITRGQRKSWIKEATRQGGKLPDNDEMMGRMLEVARKTGDTTGVNTIENELLRRKYKKLLGRKK